MSAADDALILVVDDDDEIRTLLARVLGADGFRVTLAADIPSAVAALASRPPDLVVLDVMLGGDDGLDLLGTIRRTNDTPVILLTGKSAESDRVLGLKLGADDYLVKPFSPAELSARISSVLRRSQPGGARTVLDFGELRIDTGTREVRVGGETTTLTAREFDLLAFMAASPRQVFGRDQLLQRVWSSSSDWQDPATVTEHIRRVRRKIEANPDQPRWLTTVRGVGYRFEP